MRFKVFNSRIFNGALKVSTIALSAGLWTVATSYSLNSAFGSISTNRTDMAGLREAKATNYDAISKQLALVQDQQRWLDEKYRATGAVKGDMAGMRQSHLWARTNACTNATVPESRGFCQKYFALASELGTAQRAEDLDTKAAALRDKLAVSGGRILADPHASFLNELTGYAETTILLGWLLLIVVLIEAGSTLGPVVLYMAGLVHEKAREAATAVKADDGPNDRAKAEKPAAAETSVPDDTTSPPGESNVTKLDDRWDLTRKAEIKIPPLVKAPRQEMTEIPKLTITRDPGWPVLMTIETNADDTLPQETNVVRLYEQPVSRREEKRRKKELIEQQNRSLVYAYADKRLDTEAPEAQIMLTEKGGHLAGGTIGDTVYTDFRRWCRDNGDNPVGRNHFGRFIGELVDRARNSKGVVYGAVIRQSQQRKAA
jgi:hypothetical protein